MKKEPFTEKLIKRTFGISGPLDEHQKREADRIGNQVFIVLFYMMVFANIIPLFLAKRYPEIIALGYPILIFLFSIIISIYVSYQSKKSGITAIDPEILEQKESKRLPLSGLKAGIVYGIIMFFSLPFLSILMGDARNYSQNLFNIKHICSTLFASVLFGIIVQIVIYMRIPKAKNEQDDD